MIVHKRLLIWCALFFLSVCLPTVSLGLSLTDRSSGLPAGGAEGNCLLITSGVPAWGSCLTTGSTGISGATTFGVLYGTSATTASSTAALTNGQLVIGRAGNSPVPGSLTGTLPMIVTPGSGTITLSIADAAADGSTKGIATFAAADFTVSAGVVTLDYANAQPATAVQPGFLTAADWNTFNLKGDVAGVASSVDNEVALFSGTGGKTLKRATTTGLLKATSGVLAAAVPGTDYLTSAGNIATATALQNDPGDCGPDTYATAIAVTGTLTCAQVSLSAGVTGDLTYANLTPATTHSRLLGRGSASGGDWEEIQVGAGLFILDNTLAAVGETPLTYAAGVQLVGTDVSTASTEPGFLVSGMSDLTAGGGEGGKLQTRTDGSLEYTDAATPSVRHRGFVLPFPFKFNLGTGSGCKTDANGGALTINASDEVVCKSDAVGEGGGGPGDLTAFGSCATGDCATTGSPLTSYWMSGSAAPAAPAAGQGRVFFDETAKNLAVIADDSAIKYGAQVIAATEHFFLTSFAADGTFAAVRPSLATLSDNATVAKLDATQTLTNKQHVPRVCQLSATSGSVTPNLDLCDVVYRYDVDGALTLQTPTATGSNPRHEQMLTFDLCAALAQSLTWSSAYAGNYGLALPATLPAGRCMAIAYRYSTNSSKYELWSVHEPNPLVNTVRLQGTTSGVVTLQPQAVAGTYNFNLPTTAGTAGQPLLSGGGGATPMSFAALNLAGGSSIVTGDLPYANLTAAGSASKLLGRGASGAGDWQEITLGTGLSMSGTTLNAAVGGTGTIHLFVASPMLPTSGAALVSGAGNYYKLIFDDTTEWCAWWQVDIPTDYASGLRFEGTYAPAGASSGSLNFDISVMATTPDTDAVSFETDDYDTVNNCDDTAIPTSANFPSRLGCNLTNADSVAAEDVARIKICRKTADDTAATQIHLITGVLQYVKQ